MRKRQLNNGLLSFGGSVAMIQGVRQCVKQLLPRGNRWYFQDMDTTRTSSTTHTKGHQPRGGPFTHNDDSPWDEDDFLSPEHITEFLIDTIKVIEDNTLEERYVTDKFNEWKQWLEQIDNKWLVLVLFLCLFLTPLAYLFNRFVRFIWRRHRSHGGGGNNARHRTPPNSRQVGHRPIVGRYEQGQVDNVEYAGQEGSREVKKKKEKIQGEEEFINTKPEFIMVSDAEIDESDNDIDKDIGNNIIKTINDSFEKSFLDLDGTRETIETASNMDTSSTSNDHTKEIPMDLERIIEESIDANIESLFDPEKSTNADAALAEDGSTIAIIQTETKIPLDHQTQEEQEEKLQTENHNNNFFLEQDEQNEDSNSHVTAKRSILSELLQGDKQDTQTQDPLNAQDTPTDHENDNSNSIRSEPIQIGHSYSTKSNSFNSLLIPNLSTTSVNSKKFIKYSPTKNSVLHSSVDTSHAYSQPFTF